MIIDSHAHVVAPESLYAHRAMLLADGGEHSCGSILDDISKSTLTHHWRVLRDSGVIWQCPHGRENLLPGSPSFFRWAAVRRRIRGRALPKPVIRAYFPSSLTARQSAW